MNPNLDIKEEPLAELEFLSTATENEDSFVKEEYEILHLGRTFDEETDDTIEELESTVSRIINNNKSLKMKHGRNKKKRTENWTNKDKSLLQQLVRDRVYIIENKSTDTNTCERKNKAWKQIEESFNGMACTKRIIPQLRQQWSIMKMNAKKEIMAEKKEILTEKREIAAEKKEIVAEKKEIAAEKKEIVAEKKEITAEKEEVTELESDNILAWLPQESTADKNELDSDQVQDVIICGQPQTSEIIENSNRSRRKRKRQDGTESKITSDSINSIAKIETECRMELHKTQMEIEKKKLQFYELQIQNERKRGENIDLEKKLLLKKLNSLH